jgi:hypothetical protein
MSDETLAVIAITCIFIIGIIIGMALVMSVL